MVNPHVNYLEAWFNGRVQGVGFRYTTLQIAKEFEVTGTVQNLIDGRVHLIAEGTGDEISAFVNEISNQMEAYIRDTEIKEGQGPRRYRTFEII